MLKQAFSWLYSHSTDLSLTSSPITRAACLQAIHVATEQYEQSLKTYRGLKYASTQNSESLQRALAEVKLSEQYSDFLRKCDVFLQDLRPCTLYELMLMIALADSSLRSRVSPIFSAWLAQDVTSALEYYDRYFDGGNRKVSEDSPETEIVFLRGKRAVQDYLADLRLALQNQESPLAICRLLPTVAGSPIRYAAFLIWMLEQGVSIEQLVQSGILQKFLGYHFNSLYSDDFEGALPPVALLYGFLQQFDCAVSLVDYAKQISCGIRGHSAYNLLGQQQESLVRIECVTEFPLLTRTVANIKQMIHVFGQEGLSESVRTLFHLTQAKPLDDPFHRSLVEFVRENPALLTPGLIQQIAEVNIMDLPKWVLLIDDGLFQQWLESNERAVIYLIPHKPHWMNQVTVARLQLLLDLIKNTYQSGAEVENMRLLMCLYQIASSSASDHAIVELIYEEMFDLTLQHRYLLEDAALVRTLRLSWDVEKCVDKKVVDLIKKLEEKIQAFFNQLPLNANFSCLISEWSGLASQIEVLQQVLHKIKVVFPRQEIDLIVYLFQQYSHTPKPFWNQLLDALELREMDALRSDERSRQVLLNILTVVDDEQLRQIIISQLNVDRRQARTQLLLDAIQVGNKGLLDWYLQGANLDEQLFEKAIARQQWFMMEHWMANYTLPEFSQKLINQLLVAASGSHHTEFLRRVVVCFKGSFSIRAIAHAVRIASQLDDNRVLYHLYELRPTTMALKVAFAQTIDHRHPQALSFFIGIKKYKSNLADEMKRAFNAAVKKNDLNLVSQLTKSSVNGPSRKVIQLAMEKARDRQQTEMANLLNRVLHPLSSPNAPPKKVNVRQSFASTDSLTHLSLFSSPIEAEPSQAAKFGIE